MLKIGTDALKGTLTALALLGGTALAQDDATMEPAPASAVQVAAPGAEAELLGPPAPPTMAPAAPVTAEPVMEEVDNPYGLSAAWHQGDFVSKGAFVILGIMSAATWYVMIVKLIEQAKLLRQARKIGPDYWQQGATDSGIDSLGQGTPFWHVADRGVKAAEHYGSSSLVKTQEVDRATWIQVGVNRAADEIQSALQGGLAVLATVGSTAPFVGLFGTVWGIYHALTAIGLSGQASIDKVAGPVGEALIMTALGLAVAVPAVLGYNWLVRRNKAAMEAVRGFGADLHALLLSGSKVG
jgi:biopolymer transport protein ExbB